MYWPGTAWDRIKFTVALCTASERAVRPRGKPFCSVPDSRRRRALPCQADKSVDQVLRPIPSEFLRDCMRKVAVETVMRKSAAIQASNSTVVDKERRPYRDNAGQPGEEDDRGDGEDDPVPLGYHAQPEDEVRLNVEVDCRALRTVSAVNSVLSCEACL